MKKQRFTKALMFGLVAMMALSACTATPSDPSDTSPVTETEMVTQGAETSSQETIDEITTDTSGEIVTDTSAETSTEDVTGAPDEVVTDASGEVVTEAVTNAPVEVPTEAVTNAPAEEPTEAATNAPVEAPTEAATNAPVEAPTEAVTNAPVETPTEAVTEAATQAPAAPLPSEPVKTITPTTDFRMAACIDAINEVAYPNLHATKAAPVVKSGLSLSSDCTLTVSGWAMVNGGQDKYYWSVDKTTWYEFTKGTVSDADDAVAEASVALGNLNQTNTANARFASLAADLSAYKGQVITVYVAVRATTYYENQKAYPLCHFLTLENLSVAAQGPCDNVHSSDASSKVGVRRIDTFSHQTTKVNYLDGSIANLPGWSGVVTVDETTGTFEIRGWIGFNFNDYEFAWRIGTYNETQYRNWSVVTEPNAIDIAAVKDAAQKEGYSNAMRYVYYLGADGFESGDRIHLLLKDKTTGTVYCFAEFVVKVNQPDVDVLQKYQLGYNSTMDMSACDPITNKETVTAPNDDATLKLWFDHLTEKVARYDTSGKDSGASSYTIQMAKNEMEGCHFYLYSPTNRKVTVKYSQFENANGEKLDTELGVEFYIEEGYITHKDYTHYKTFNVGDKDSSGEKTVDVYADAVIPYESYVKAGYGGDEGGYYIDANGDWQAMEYGDYVNIGKYTPKNWDLDNYPYRDTVRGFVVQATTTANTTPGAYKATIEIYDYDTGECIKMANVYTYVYNVTLSEETALDTAIGIWGNNYTATYDAFGGWNGVEVTQALADFMLKYRMTPNFGTWVLDNVLCPDGDNTWLYNPRVTTLKIFNEEMYNRYKDDPILSEKMFYYGQDEPGIPRNQWRDFTLEDGSKVSYFDQFGILSLLGVAEEAKMLQSWGWEDYRLVIPFERNNQLSNLSRYYSIMKESYIPNLGWANVEYSIANNGNPAGAMELYNKYKTELQSAKDMVDFLDNYITVWTYIPSGSAPRELQSNTVKEAYYMQDVQLDATYGEYADRMSGLQAGGDELWSYVACEPKWDAPYQNILLFNDGTEARTMFWTNYMLGQTGFLYWREDYYGAVQASTYAMRNPFSATGPGDGILIYPGAIYGQLDPIPSIRFINMRDGIEDYQLLTMLETAKGETYTNELVSHVVTSTVTFTRDGDQVYNVHAYLLRVLEAAQNAN